MKIAVIGAGSATFSLGLVKDLCLTERLMGSRVAFMDIDPDPPGQHHRPRRALQPRSWGPTCASSRPPTARTALDGADFVINTADAKGHYHQRAMRELTADHGYYYGGRLASAASTTSA